MEIQNLKTSRKLKEINNEVSCYQIGIIEQHIVITCSSMVAPKPASKNLCLGLGLIWILLQDWMERFVEIRPVGPSV